MPEFKTVGDVLDEVEKIQRANESLIAIVTDKEICREYKNGGEDARKLLMNYMTSLRALPLKSKEETE